MPEMWAWPRRTPRSTWSQRLNQDTLACLDAFVTMRSGDKMAHLETIQDRLRCIPYIQMLAYLKEGELSELAR